jgi:multicomponent K+:H+ antiporter subunit G
MDLLLELLIVALLVVSGIFGLVGSYGLLKLRDTMQRLHAPTKATTVGVGAGLIASILHVLLVEGRLSIHELLITLFLFLSAPITAFFIAQVHLSRKVPPDALPRSGGEYGWSVHDDPPDRAR